MKRSYTMMVVLSLAMLVLSIAAWATSGPMFGNAPIDRAITDGAGTVWNNFVALDLNPGYTISQPGKLTRWNWFAKPYFANQNDLPQQMDLMVWRPVANVQDSFQLICSQRVTNTDWGAQWEYAKVVGDPIVKPGDVLGYYVPEGYKPVLALDYVSGSGGDWYQLNSGPLAVGTVLSFTPGLNNNGSRTYSLSADLTAVPEPGTILAACAILSPVGLVFRRRRK